MKHALTLEYRSLKTRHVDYEFVTLIVLALIAVIISFFIQQTILNRDVGIIIHETNQMLAGGNYVSSFFETNPPMILYLTVPVCFIADLLSVNPLNIAYDYISILALLSALTSYYLLTRLVRDKLTPSLCFAAMLYAFFLIPLSDFGEREHFTMILTTPYLFAAALAFANKPVSKQLGFWIGLAGGIGFAIKPYFLIPLCLIELSFILRYSTIFAWVRIESMTVLGVMLSYMASIWYFHPAYLQVILPLLNRYYFNSIHIEMHTVIINKTYNFCATTFLAALLFLRNSRNSNTLLMLILFQVGFIGSYLITRTEWYYHMLPSLSASILLITFCISSVVVKWIDERHISFTPDFIAVMAIYFLFYAYILSGTPNFSENLLISVKFICLINLTSILAFMLYLDKKSWPLAFSILALTLWSLQIKTIPFELYALHFDGYYFVMLDFMLAWIAINTSIILLFTTTSISKSWFPALQKSFYFILFIFAVYFFGMNNIYNLYVVNRLTMAKEAQMVSYIKQFPDRGGIFCVSSIDPGACVSLSYYTHIALVGRHPSLWWVRGMGYAQESPQKNADEKYLANIVATDIMNNKPEWIFVSVKDFLRLPNFHLFDMLAINQNFNNEWSKYKLMRTFPFNSPAQHSVEYYVYKRMHA
jgi:hypothetical protein